MILKFKIMNHEIMNTLEIPTYKITGYGLNRGSILYGATARGTRCPPLAIAPLLKRITFNQSLAVTLEPCTMRKTPP